VTQKRIRFFSVAQNGFSLLYSDGIILFTASRIVGTCNCECFFSNFNYTTCFRRGAIITTFIVCYALTSFISGYVSAGIYSRNGGMVPQNFLSISSFDFTVHFSVISVSV
jgi:hypothetical protein